MFRIGDFSKLSQVSVKALRYYDEIGLLKPAQVDNFTGYRYYSADQLPRLNRILALKDLGFSLDQIEQLLDDGLPTLEIRGMLRLRQAELQKELEEERGRLARVEARLRQIEKEGVMPSYEVVLKKIEPMLVASVRETIPTYSDIGRLYGEVFGYLGQHGIRPVGPPMGIYYDPEYRERDADVEAAVPVGSSAPSSERVQVHELSGAESMASLIHHGSYDDFGQAYAAIMAWIEANRYRIVGPSREIYLNGPGTGASPESYVTEIQFPVEKI